MQPRDSEDGVLLRYDRKRGQAVTKRSLSPLDSLADDSYDIEKSWIAAEEASRMLHQRK